jgi:antitoxin component YwqK of YwqJK toxin-antitoxin module
MEGVFRAWHENGRLSEEIAMKHNQPEGEARTWYPSGFLKAARGTNLAGKTEHRVWKDGEVRSWPEALPKTP